MAKVIMVQGSMSNVGKTLLTAGLCRVFKQDGHKVAPFKSQNMSGNSHACADGTQMSRAQAIQAEACGIEPNHMMNPILLKPVDDIGSEVIVNGESRGVMKAAEYFAVKKSLVPDIIKSYNELAKEYDIVVIEGAGSPAEINLREDDIVNMGLAKLLRSPVLLVGDINMGGVFAQLVGTLELLERDEREMVKALIINKFRGDTGLLSPGLDMLAEKTGKRIAGVVPYLSVEIEPEDSLARDITGKTDPREYDVLAGALRKHLDMKLIYEILEAGA